MSLWTLLALANPFPADQVSAGQGHTCALSGQELWCWGGATAAQARSGAGSPRPLPERVEGRWRQVSAGGRGHTCAVDTEGGVFCWDLEGPPVQVPGVHAEEVSVGIAHACARGGERVWCWGSNTYGQLGDGTTTPREGPVEARVDRARSIDAGDMHTCAVRSDGTLACWGHNKLGQVGSGSGSPAVASPEPVAWVQDAVQVSAGGFFTCARLRGGAVVCWGDNIDGQLGNAARAASPVPVGVKGVTDLVDLSCGFAHACGVRSDGKLWCWGASEAGQIGSDDTVDHLLAGLVRGVDDARGVDAGQQHTCLIRADGLHCMGDGSSSQLGDGGRGGGAALRAVRGR